MTYTLTTSGAALMKAGENADSSITLSGALLDSLSDMAEGKIVMDTRKDWVTDYSSLSTEAKALLNHIASSIMAMGIISYNMDGYTSRSEAQTLLDINDDIVRTGIATLKDFKSVDGIRSAV